MTLIIKKILLWKIEAFKCVIIYRKFRVNATYNNEDIQDFNIENKLFYLMTLTLNLTLRIWTTEASICDLSIISRHLI